MTMQLTQSAARGGATVAVIADLDAIAAASVIYLRMWSDGPDSQQSVCGDFISALGPEPGHRATETFSALCDMTARYGRRPLMRHAIKCKCVGADEACFAHFISTAIEGDRDDTMLIATLLVRPDVAPILASLATNFGIALKRMNLAAPRDMVCESPSPTTLH